jgi:hypothetical protein
VITEHILQVRVSGVILMVDLPRPERPICSAMAQHVKVWMVSSVNCQTLELNLHPYRDRSWFSWIPSIVDGEVMTVERSDAVSEPRTDSAAVVFGW